MPRRLPNGFICLEDYLMILYVNVYGILGAPVVHKCVHAFTHQWMTDCEELSGFNLISVKNSCQLTLRLLSVANVSDEKRSMINILVLPK